jgi:hypothetical protein
MDTFGLFAKGSIVIEKINLKLPWTRQDSGRIIYEISTDKIWIGGTDSYDGVNGWFQIGLTEDSINDYHIDWDTELTFLSNKISAVNIPCLYQNKTNIQNAITLIIENLNNIEYGKTIKFGVINPDHLNLTLETGLTANYIKILNTKKYFLVSNVDLALNYCYEIASNPLLPKDTKFGQLLGIQVFTINDALIELEKYVVNLQARDISATYLLAPDLTNVQYVLDALYRYVVETERLAKLTHNIIDLQGVPDNFGINKQILQSNGIDGYCLVNLTANIVSTRYCSNDTNVQLALDIICGDISSIYDTIDIILLDISNIKIQIVDILCQIEHLWEQITLIWIAICEIWNDIEKIWTQIHLIWEQIDLIWDQICRIWEEFKKVWIVINSLKNSIKKKKIYFSLMKFTTDWQFGHLKDKADSINYPPMWLNCDFTQWYNDYKVRYDPAVGKKFIVVPIVQFQSFMIPNAFQTYDYLKDPSNNRNPVWCKWPPVNEPTVTYHPENMEGGTIGEYPFVLYRGALGGNVSDGMIYSQCIKPYYLTNNWVFNIDIGTVPMDNDRNLKTYSGGSRIDYVVYFFGFGTSNDAILNINSNFNTVLLNAAAQSSSSALIPTLLQSEIIN